MPARSPLRMPALLLAGAWLSACASTPGADPARLGIYLAHAGEPVASIPYLSPASGFATIDGEHLLLMQSPRRNWLLRIDPPCLDDDSISPRLVIHSSGSRVSANFDSVGSQSRPGLRCTIREIRPVDLDAARAAERAARGAP